MRIRIRLFAKFSVELLDTDRVDIRASFFGNAADRFHPLLEVGRCYTFSRGKVKAANARYAVCRHPYELIFEQDALIEESADDEQIASVSYSFLDLQALQSRASPCVVDLCGVVTTFLPLQRFMSSSGKEMAKRDVTIADHTGHSLRVNLWDRSYFKEHRTAGQEPLQRAQYSAEQKADRAFEGHPVICLRGVSVQEWKGGLCGSLCAEGHFALLPGPSSAGPPEAERLRAWWTSGGGAAARFKPLSTQASGGVRVGGTKAMTLADIRRAADLVGDTPELYTVVCRLAQVQLRKGGEPQPLVYMACQEAKSNGKPCSKRVDASGYCAACNRSGRASPRLTLRCRFADGHDKVWLTTFDEPSQTVVGLQAEEARQLEAAGGGERGGGGRERGGREVLEAAVAKACFRRPLQLTVKATLVQYNGQMRTNIVCVDARPVPRREHGRLLLREIRALLAI